MTAHATPPQPAAPTATHDAADPLEANAPTIAAGTPRDDARARADAAEDRRHLAARVLADALLLGVVGDALLRVSSWGVNFSIWSVGIVAAMLTVARRRYDVTPPDARWLAIPAVALGLMFVWRESASLAAYNALALAGTLALLATAIARGPQHSLVGSRVRDLVRGAATVAASALFGMLPLVLVDVSLREVARARGAARLIAGVRAALIAVPLLLVFGGLFASADPVFARIAGQVLRLDVDEVASHLVFGGGIAWLVGGLLRGTVLAPAKATWGTGFLDGTLGLTEVAVTLGSLVLLFAAFVLVQLRYFFGGEALVRATAGLGYADYARRGFFELVTVSALVLPVLLAAGALLRRDTPRAERVYRALSAALIALLAVIMYSALARMRLYQAAYGLSTDRLYATAFMAWLAMVFGWFCVTVLRGRERGFSAGLPVSAWGVIALLNALDPAGLVARSNIARAARGQPLDVSYTASLGADAAPALVRYLAGQPLTPPAAAAGATPNVVPDAREWDAFTARCHAARRLLDAWGPSSSNDWRSWTVGRAAARRAVAAREPALRQLASLPASPVRPVPCPAAAPPTAASQ